LTFEAFQRRSEHLWHRIPQRYREGVDGLVVSREIVPSPDTRDVYTLGECLTETYPSDFEGPETVRSVIALYYGSFRRMAAGDPHFDWDREIWETLTHELQHHLESLAEEDALEGYDHAAEQHFRRQDGEAFDPYYYRYGMVESEGVYRVEGDVFIELILPPDALAAGQVEFEWQGRRFRVPVPDDPGDVCYIRLRGERSDGGDVSVVVVQRRGWLEVVRRLLRHRVPRVVVLEASPEALPRPRPASE
jgi:Zincin-like metallopeptidase